MPTPLYSAGQQYPMFNPPANTPPAANSVYNTVPRFNGMSQTATGNISQQLAGLPSAAPAQRANAYFGVTSGMPNSDFIRNRGFDLYGQQAQQYKQQGLDNFLKLLQGYSGTVMPTAGQQLQGQQFNTELASRERAGNINQANEQQNQDFTRMQWGQNRPWSSDNSGNVFDRVNKRLGYQPQYDRGILM